MAVSDWPVPRRMWMGTAYAAGFGHLAGGLEFVAIAAQQTLALSVLASLGLGLAALVSMGLFAVLLGALVAPVHLLFARARVSTAIAVQLTLVGFLLCGFHLWQLAFDIFTDERAPAALAMAAMPLGFTGVIYFNARFLLRRHEAGKAPAPWLPVAFALGLVFVLAATGFQALRDTGGSHAIEDDRNVLLVTLDGWSGPVTLPGGTVFTQAVSPGPDTRPGAAAVLTGLHPLRNRVLFAGDPLRRHYQSLAEILMLEGYATGAFVSHPALVASSGLQQGFKVYDDDFSPLVPGALRLNLLGHLLSGMASGRTADDTLARFTAWLADNQDVPFLAWVHLPADGAARIPEILTAIEPVAEETLVVITATHGTPTRTDGSLYDDRVHVPLALRAPGVTLAHPEVQAQVRLVDVLHTAVTWLAVDGPETEGVLLTDYMNGTRDVTMGTTLIGRDASGVVSLGLRNAGAKIIADREGRNPRLYRLADDPGETRDLAAEQPEAMKQADRILGADALRLQKLRP